MTFIIFDQQHIELNDGQTVLSALLERNYDIPNSCQAGVCQSCLMQASEGEIPAAAQNGLKDTLKTQGYFLACSCTPKTPLQINLASDLTQQYAATVVEHQQLSADVLCLRLKPHAPFDYRAGQFITLWKDKMLGRSYSLASVSALDDNIELHIRRIQGGQMSHWLHDEIKLGDQLHIQNATGDCFYVADKPEQKILLAGTGTGLAPLIGIARDALQQHHQGDIHLLHGALKTDDLYKHQTLLDMAKQYQQFHYHANVLHSTNPTLEGVIKNEITLEQHAAEIAQKPADWKAYLCGDANIVNSLKKKLFLSGMNMSSIYSDPFVLSNKA